MNKEEKERRKDDFEAWVTFIPDEVAELKKMLPKELSETLDYSINSLNNLEKYLLQSYSSETFVNAENKILLDRLARYIGLTFKRNIPTSYWDIELDDEKDVYYTLPVIKIKDINLAPFSPHMLVTTTLDRERGTF